MTVRIKSLDALRATRTPIVINEPIDSPKVWKIEANEKGKIILERMQADIWERKAEMPKLNIDGFSGRFNYPSKTATGAEETCTDSFMPVTIGAKPRLAMFPLSSFNYIHICPNQEGSKPFLGAPLSAIRIVMDGVSISIALYMLL